MVSAIQLFSCFFFFAGLLSAQILATGTTLQARFSGATGSRISHNGDAIEAVVIAPVTLEGNIVIAQGSLLRGSVQQVIPIGLGIRHFTASIRYRFSTLQFVNGQTAPVDLDLVRVETAKERVDAAGVVRGVHPGANLSSASGFYTLPLLFVNPVFGMPLWGIKALVAPSTSPEIYFPPGAEFVVRLNSDLDVSGLPPQPGPVSSFSENEVAIFRDHLKASHARAQSGKQPSDLVNLLMVGTRQQIDSAFQAAGWVTAERGSPVALYRMYNALTKRVGYRKAPMKSLSLNGRPSDFVYQKSLNNIAARHHVRFFRQASTGNLWFATATEDVALCFRRMHWTHRIDPAIDQERAKIVNDLAFTGCVESASLLSPETRQDKSISTDGDIAVIRFNGCERPRVMPGVDARNTAEAVRWLPRVMLSFRDDMVKLNPVFTAYNSVRCLAAKQRGKEQGQNIGTARLSAGLDWVRTPQRLETGTN